MTTLYSETSKVCPQCAENVQRAAAICRFCNHDFRAGTLRSQSGPTNGLAIASLVLGILWLWWIGSILALIFGYVSRNQISDTNGRQGGAGIAVAGIVLGWIGVGTLCLF